MDTVKNVELNYPRSLLNIPHVHVWKRLIKGRNSQPKHSAPWQAGTCLDVARVWLNLHLGSHYLAFRACWREENKRNYLLFNLLCRLGSRLQFQLFTSLAVFRCTGNIYRYSHLVSTCCCFFSQLTCGQCFVLCHHHTAQPVVAPGRGQNGSAPSWRAAEDGSPLV